MSKNKTKNITIDDLAVILSKQFDSINKQFDSINNQFDNVNKQFDNIDKKFDGVNKKFDGVNKQLQELKQGHENIELRLANVAYRFELQELQGVVKNLQKQVVLLNVKMGVKDINNEG